MAIDANIYSQVKAPDASSPFEGVEQGMRLSQLGMQQAQMGYQMKTQMAARQAMQANTDPQTGQLNRGGFLTDIGKIAPEMQMKFQSDFAAQDKAKAEAQTAQMQAQHGILSVTIPALKYLHDLPDDQAAAAYPGVVSQLAAQGVPMNNIPAQWDRAKIEPLYKQGMAMKEQMDTALTGAQTAETYSKIGEVADKRLLALKDDLDPDKARGNNLAANQARVYKAQGLQGLLKQTNGNPDPRQMVELAIGAQNMLSNGNSSVEEVRSLIPATAWGNRSKLLEWFTNDPHGTNQQKFVERIGDTIQREMDIAQGQVRNTQIARAGAHQLLQKTNPRGYYSVLSDYGIKPENIKDGKYVPSQEPQDLASNADSGGLIANANAGEKQRAAPAAMPKFRPGAIVTTGGKHYRVGPDGDELLPVGTTK
jgi:hypothetical protein